MIFVTVLIVIVAILLVLVVLTQNPKGGGLSQFAGSGSQLMGVKKTGDLLERLTWGLGVALIVLCIVANLITKPASTVDEEEPSEDQTTQQPAGNQQQQQPQNPQPAK